MFQCEYSLNGECQIFTSPCKKLECEIYSGCHSCRFRWTNAQSEPCVRCDDSKEKKHGLQ